MIILEPWVQISLNDLQRASRQFILALLFRSCSLRAVRVAALILLSAVVTAVLDSTTLKCDLDPVCKKIELHLFCFVFPLSRLSEKSLCIYQKHGLAI